jgi:hypothetical protein
MAEFPVPPRGTETRLIPPTEGGRPHPQHFDGQIVLRSPQSHPAAHAVRVPSQRIQIHRRDPAPRGKQQLRRPGGIPTESVQQFLLRKNRTVFLNKKNPVGQGVQRRGRKIRRRFVPDGNRVHGAPAGVRQELLQPVKLAGYRGDEGPPPRRTSVGGRKIKQPGTGPGPTGSPGLPGFGRQRGRDSRPNRGARSVKTARKSRLVVHPRPEGGIQRQSGHRRARPNAPRGSAKIVNRVGQGQAR